MAEREMTLDEARIQREEMERIRCIIDKQLQYAHQRGLAEGAAQGREALAIAGARHNRIQKFLFAYAHGQALTFVDPRNGVLTSATKEAQALALACIHGPLSLTDDELRDEIRSCGEKDRGDGTK